MSHPSLSRPSSSSSSSWNALWPTRVVIAMFFVMTLAILCLQIYSSLQLSKIDFPLYDDHPTPHSSTTNTETKSPPHPPPRIAKDNNNNNNNNNNNVAAVVTFESNTNFQNILPTLFQERTMSNYCQQQEQKEQQQEASMTNNPLNTRMVTYSKGGDEHIASSSSSSSSSWYGSELPNAADSCQFVTKSFRPTESTIDNLLQQQTVYLTTFQRAAQCNALSWNLTLAKSCLRNNFGVMGHVNYKDCQEQSVGGHHVHIFRQQHLTNIANAVKQMVLSLLLLQKRQQEEEGSTSEHNGEAMARAAQQAVLNSTHAISGEGYGGNHFQKWNRQFLSIIVANVEKALQQQQQQQQQNIMTMNLWSNITKQIEHDFEHIVDATSWESQLQLTPTTLDKVNFPMISAMSQSIQGILPPSPYLVYTKNAVLGKAVHVPNELYTPGCGPWWQSITDAESRVQTNLFMQHRATHPEVYQKNGGPKMARSEILRVCSNTNSSSSAAVGKNNANATIGECPFPIYDRVIHVHQAYCDGFFHFMIEVWPRIGPWIETILEDEDMYIYIGCFEGRGKRSAMHKNFYGLLGIDESRLLNDGDGVFAKEVYIPTVGYSHGPYYNMWNLMSIRNHVEKRHGAPSPLNDGNNNNNNNNNPRNIMVMLRDKGRRLDANQFSTTFFEQMEELLPSDNINKFAASNETLMSCLVCQMKAFQEADVIIGSHGAGLSHLMWAKHGATVLEVLPSNQDSSIYAELPFMFGQKYFPMSTAATAKDFVHIIEFAKKNGNER